MDAVMVCASKGKLKNMGDYAQSLAARQFAKNPIYVNREELDSYNGPQVRMIMNGWFMHYPDRWPPSDKIEPYFTSFHINPAVANRLLSERGVEYLKKHQPIGCRDRNTMRLLRAKGIAAYFSGCLTLTLGNVYQRKVTEDALPVFVDPPVSRPHSKCEMIRALPKNVLLFLRHPVMSFRIAKKISVLDWTVNYPYALIVLYAARFYHEYSCLFTDELLLKADYITHSVPVDAFYTEEDRFAWMDKMMRRYSSAPFIVTGRIHCALPCLGVGVPVLYVYDAHNDGDRSEMTGGRLDGLLELFNVAKVEKGTLRIISCANELNRKIGLYSKFENKDTWRPIARALTEACSDFMKR